MEVDEAESLFAWQLVEDASEATEPAGSAARRRRGSRILLASCLLGALAAAVIGVVAAAYLVGRAHKPTAADEVRTKYEHVYARCVAAGLSANACEGNTENVCLQDRRLADDPNTLSSVCSSFSATAGRSSR